MLEMLGQFAESAGMGDSVHRRAATTTGSGPATDNAPAARQGDVASIDNVAAVKQAFVDSMLGWARDAVLRSQSATAPRSP